MVWRAYLAVGIAFVLSGILKVITSRGAWRPFSLGGMPSTHSALVSSLAAAAWFETGFSVLFLACLIFSAIVVRDAFGVRLEVTRHSEALNRLVKKGGYRRTGHTAMEAAAGVGLGVVVTALVYAF